MIILGIETSCDETSAAILEQKNDRVIILSNVTSSSLELHAKYGGVIPEQAAREQLKLIIPVIDQAINESELKIEEIDSIAVTQGPGLVGSLLVGVETAKTLALVWGKTLIRVNHLIGHFYANWIDGSSPQDKTESVILNTVKDLSASLSVIETNSKILRYTQNDRKKESQSTPSFPCVGLLVSGGHSDLVLFKDHGIYEYLGGTRDDAAGECFDKCARMLGYAYPGGPKISKLAEGRVKSKYNLPKPMADSKDFDFSFSGLKTAFNNLLQKNFKLERGYYDLAIQTWKQKTLEEQLSPSEVEEICCLCKELEDTIVESLVKKTVVAVQKYKVDQVIVAGGVAANKKLKEELEKSLNSLSREVRLFIPPPILCTDNAAMIASATFFNKKVVDPLDLQADPGLSL